MGGVFETSLGRCTVSMGGSQLSTLPNSSEHESAPRLLPLESNLMAMSHGESAHDISGIMSMGSDAAKAMKGAASLDDVEETIEVSIWRGHRNDADAKAAFLGASACAESSEKSPWFPFQVSVKPSSS